MIVDVPIQCYWSEQTDTMKVSLRVYHPKADPRTIDADTCPLAVNHGYHQAWLQIEDKPLKLTQTGYVMALPDDPNETRWPTNCPCGYHFSASDVHQFFEEPYYRRLVDGKLFTQRSAPAGSMWHADWLKGLPTIQVRPDGLIVVVKLPCGAEWCVDDVTPSGDRWARTGEVPHITVTPSIVVGDDDVTRFHGNLINGVLVPV